MGMLVLSVMLRLWIDSFGGLFCFVLLLLFFLLYHMAGWILAHQAGIDPVSSLVEGGTTEPPGNSHFCFLVF